MALKVISPLAPLHNGSMVCVAIVKALGSLIVKIVNAVQPLPSVAITVYVPAAELYGEEAVVPFTVYVNDSVPPEALKFKIPSLPLQRASVTLAVNTTCVGSVTVTIDCALHPFISVAVIV